MREVSYLSCAHRKCNADLTRKGVKRRRCAGCHSVFYDDVACQKSDWAIHKTECKAQQRRFIKTIRPYFPQIDSMEKLLANPDACGNIAKCYFNGSGGYEQNHGLAVFWTTQWMKSADPGARAALGTLYFSGTGVPMDIRKGFKLLKRAAEDGDAEAQCRVGTIYSLGEGVRLDEKEAVRWFRKSADQGFSVAQHQLSGCLEFGSGCKTNKKQALAWLRKAAEQGNALAQFDLGCACRWIHEKAKMEAQKDPRRQPAADAAALEAVTWYRKSAEKGNDQAECLYGACLMDGMGVAQDPTEAVVWYRKSAEHGNAGAQYQLGRFHLTGIGGVTIDRDEANVWFRRAKDQGYDVSAVKRACMEKRDDTDGDWEEEGGLDAFGGGEDVLALETMRVGGGVEGTGDVAEETGRGDVEERGT